MPEAAPTGQSASDIIDGAPEHPGGEGAPSPSEITAPWADVKEGTWTLGEGENAKPWYATVPEEEVRATMEAKAYANPAELAMAYHNLLKLQTGNDNVVALPKEGASEEEWNAFHTKMGRPQTPDDYSLEFGENADPNMSAFGKKFFHALGLDPARAQKGVEMWNEFRDAEETRLAETWTNENAEAVATLKGELGAEYDAYIAAGKRVVKGSGLKAEHIDALEADIGTASVLRVLGAVGRAFSEGKLLAGGGGGGELTKEQAASEIEKREANEEFMKRYNAGEATAVKEMEALYAAS